MIGMNFLSSFNTTNVFTPGEAANMLLTRPPIHTQLRDLLEVNMEGPRPPVLVPVVVQSPRRSAFTGPTKKTGRKQWQRKKRKQWPATLDSSDSSPWAPPQECPSDLTNNFHWLFGSAGLIWILFPILHGSLHHAGTNKPAPRRSRAARLAVDPGRSTASARGAAAVPRPPKRQGVAR